MFKLFHWINHLRFFVYKLLGFEYQNSDGFLKKLRSLNYLGKNPEELIFPGVNKKTFIQNSLQNISWNYQFKMEFPFKKQI